MILLDKAMPSDDHHAACVAIVCDAIVHDEERLRCDAMSAFITMVRCDAIAMGARMGAWPSRLIAMESVAMDRDDDDPRLRDSWRWQWKFDIAGARDKPAKSDGSPICHQILALVAGWLPCWLSGRWLPMSLQNVPHCG